jgi:hypothetical protein
MSCPGIDQYNHGGIGPGLTRTAGGGDGDAVPHLFALPDDAVGGRVHPHRVLALLPGACTRTLLTSTGALGGLITQQRRGLTVTRITCQHSAGAYTRPLLSSP